MLEKIKLNTYLIENSKILNSIIPLKLPFFISYNFILFNTL